jgi:nucleoside-diphosphate-sugar epimerase
MPSNRKILIAGCGYIGTALGMRLTASGDRVWGLRRNIGKLPKAIQPLEADLTDAAAVAALKLDADAVVYCASAQGSSDHAYQAAYVEGLRNLLEALKKSTRPVSRLIFVSSTRVYGQTAGEMVDEDSPVDPGDFRAQRLLEGEALARGSGLPTTIVRLGGIYGPGRPGALDRALAGLATTSGGQALYGNRIHRDDAAGIRLHVLNLPAPATLYLGVDCDPASREEVRAWLSQRIDREIPAPDQAPEDSDRSNKRCSNKRILASGYAFVYPTFREGFDALLSGDAFAGW